MPFATSSWLLCLSSACAVLFCNVFCVCLWYMIMTTFLQSLTVKAVVKLSHIIWFPCLSGKATTKLLCATSLLLLRLSVRSIANPPCGASCDSSAFLWRLPRSCRMLHHCYYSAFSWRLSWSCLVLHHCDYSVFLWRLSWNCLVVHEHDYLSVKATTKLPCATSLSLLCLSFREGYCEVAMWYIMWLLRLSVKATYNEAALCHWDCSVFLWRLPLVVHEYDYLSVKATYSYYSAFRWRLPQSSRTLHHCHYSTFLWRLSLSCLLLGHCDYYVSYFCEGYMSWS